MKKMKKATILMQSNFIKHKKPNKNFFYCLKVCHVKHDSINALGLGP